VYGISSEVAKLGQKIDPPGKKLNYCFSDVTTQGFLCVTLFPGPPPPPKTKLGRKYFSRIPGARLFINIVWGEGRGKLTHHKNKTAVKFLVGLIGKRRAWWALLKKKKRARRREKGRMSRRLRRRPKRRMVRRARERSRRRAMRKPMRRAMKRLGERKGERAAD
jgi:hypothetical protein